MKSHPEKHLCLETAEVRKCSEWSQAIKNFRHTNQVNIGLHPQPPFWVVQTGFGNAGVRVGVVYCSGCTPGVNLMFENW